MMKSIRTCLLPLLLCCLVLTGYDEDNYYFADPMQEVTAIDRDTFTLRYEQLGSHAVVITS